ncbi:SH3 domain-containing protein [Listeria booriae]|uniref:SH3 domain-containing protein n=1 Tax=Listeria booriae TaxID=1552123 RepID=A0A7X0XCH0_9LIST|nr:SH3 domain-containing protein [Listeria booriae]MBC1491383.1 SH3 domain-containing protein [Listeria booriae]MBC1523721.1 SH3 domain-containing protein [Listeria booriae]
MKKIILVCLTAVLVFATPFATIAQAAVLKEIVTQKQNIYSKPNARGSIVGYVYRGSVVKYDSLSKRTIYRKINGYLNTGYYLAPASTGTWRAAVVTASSLNLRTQPNASSKTITTLGGNEVIRVNTGAVKNGWYPVAYNRGGYWYWQGFVNSKYIIRVDGFSYDSLAQFTTL